jgi:hypothetical protein
VIILCCPVTLWPATARSLREHAPGAQVIPIPAEDISQPWETYKARWGQDDLVCVEQDIILHDTVIPSFTECPEPWCLFPHRHPCQGWDFHYTGMGCNRFRLEFQEKVAPDAIEAVPGSCNRCDGINRKCWAHLDGRIMAAGEAAGFRIHVHWPAAGHRDRPPGEYPEWLTSR